MLNIDVKTATNEDLENLDVETILAEDISQINMTSGMPDGVYIVTVSDYELKKFAARPEENKNAAVVLNVAFDIKHVVRTGPDEDIDKLLKRKHFQSYWVLSETGKAQLAKTLLGASGISYKDKNAIAQLGASLISFLDQFKDENLPFGITIKNSERNGYTNCDIVFKEDKFIPIEKAIEYLD